MGPLYPANFAASAYWLLLPTFLRILQSPKIYSVLEDLVSVVAMIESSLARKENNFSNDEEWQV
jgi:hypothetical protein